MVKAFIQGYAKGITAMGGVVVVAVVTHADMAATVPAFIAALGVIAVPNKGPGA
jgi:hypothetical protein